MHFFYRVFAGHGSSHTSSYSFQFATCLLVLPAFLACSTVACPGRNVLFLCSCCCLCYRHVYLFVCTYVYLGVGVCVCERAPSLAFCTQHSPLASCTARPELYLFLMPFAFANSFHKCCCCCCSYCCCCESCDCNTFCGRIKQKSSRRQQQQAANRKRNTTKTTTTMATLATLAMMMEMAQRGSGSGRETGIIPTRELKLPSLLICTNSRESERKKIQ